MTNGTFVSVLIMVISFFCYIGVLADKIVGLLPLQYNSDKNILEFFGGSYMDINRIFIKQNHYEFISNFYNSLNLPAKLISINQEDPYTKSLPQDNFNYFFKLSGINSFEEFFIKLFSSQTRYKFFRKIRKVEQNRITIIKNQYEDLDLLIALNKKQFGEESSFYFPNRKKIFYDLLLLPFQFIMLTFLLNDKKEAVTLSLLYKGIYYYLTSGVNSEISDLGKYTIVKNIAEAISSHADIFDVGSDDCGWKERWHTEKTIPQYVYFNCHAQGLFSC